MYIYLTIEIMIGFLIISLFVVPFLLEKKIDNLKHKIIIRILGLILIFVFFYLFLRYLKILNTPVNLIFFSILFLAFFFAAFVL